MYAKLVRQVSVAFGAQYSWVCMLHCNDVNVRFLYLVLVFFQILRQKECRLVLLLSVTSRSCFYAGSKLKWQISSIFGIFVTVYLIVIMMKVSYCSFNTTTVFHVWKKSAAVHFADNLANFTFLSPSVFLRHRAVIHKRRTRYIALTPSELN